MRLKLITVVFLNHASDLDFVRNWRLFAQHFSAEAVEGGLATTLFAPDAFDCFLYGPFGTLKFFIRCVLDLQNGGRGSVYLHR